MFGSIKGLEIKMHLFYCEVIYSNYSSTSAKFILDLYLFKIGHSRFNEFNRRRIQENDLAFSSDSSLRKNYIDRPTRIRYHRSRSPLQRTKHRLNRVRNAN